jgi:hypothetical protein
VELEGMMAYFMMKEAVASIAIEHDPGCECVACRAAHGDKEAFLDVWLKLSSQLGS